MLLKTKNKKNDDNYNYEVLFGFWGFRESGDKNSIVAISKNTITSSNVTSTVINSGALVSEFDGDHGESGNMCSILPIESNRMLYFGIYNAKLGQSSLIALMYRRIGTNV